MTIPSPRCLSTLAAILLVVVLVGAMILCRTEPTYTFGDGVFMQISSMTSLGINPAREQLSPAGKAVAAVTVTAALPIYLFLTVAIMQMVCAPKVSTGTAG